MKKTVTAVDREKRVVYLGELTDTGVTREYWFKPAQIHGHHVGDVVEVPANAVEYDGKAAV